MFTAVKGEYTVIKVAICDDNKPTLDFLERTIDELLSKNGLRHENSIFTLGTDFLVKHKEAPFDVVFLDVLMPDIGGFEVAKQVRKVSKGTYIIFITSESSLVYDSFDFQPFYFIPKSKPSITMEKLKYVINKLCIHMAAYEKVLIVGAYDNKRYVSPEEILYIKSNLNNAEYHLCDGSVQTVRNKIEGIFLSLSPYLYARPHNRFIINMAHIDDVDFPNMEIILDNGEIVKISRGYKKEFDEAYLRYMRNFS